MSKEKKLSKNFDPQILTIDYIGSRGEGVANLFTEIYYKEQGINEAFYTQNSYICLGNKILVDKIIKYENLHEEWKKFVEEYNKTAEYKIKKVLPFSNTTKNKKSWTEEFKTLTQDQLDLINTMYERDFKLFGYEMIEKE